MRVLDQASNAYGRLDDGLRKRIRRFLSNPNERSWSDIHNIVICGETMKTVWDAVRETDPTFPRYFRVDGSRLSWTRIPNPLDTLRSIKNVCSKRIP